jgi:F-type H+-transporting ATPase subunit epsilon
VADPFRVEIVSVESRVWAGEADMVVARTTEGELAVLAGHAPLLGQLKEPSRVRVRTADDEVSWDITGGFLSVTEDGVTVLAEHAEPAAGEDPAQAFGQAQAQTH